MRVRQCVRVAVGVGVSKGEVVELGELKRCVVIIEVHPGLRGRVCKVDGDVVVSTAVWWRSA